MHLICPICQLPLKLSESTYRCKRHHSYDVSKEGYVNLLPVQKKNSKNPGDSKEMINARRLFLESGYYAPLVDHLIKTIEHKENALLLDAGCGEGYYGAQIKQHINDLDILGFDISKEAIKKAAKKYKDQFFFIAGMNEIPIADQSVSTYLTIFAPIEASEINRILADRGQVIIVSAGPNHMREIAEEIYESYIPHDYDPSLVLPSQFDLINKEIITFTITLEEKDERKSMLQMTPYYWSANEKTLGKILAKNLTITCDFKINEFRKK